MTSHSLSIHVKTRLELVLERPMDALFHLGAHPDRLERLCGREIITGTQKDGSILDVHSSTFHDLFGNPVIRARLLLGITIMNYELRGTVSSAPRNRGRPSFHCRLGLAQPCIALSAAL